MGRRGLALLVAVVTIVLALAEMAEGHSPDWRIYGIVAAAALLVALIPDLRRREEGG